MLIVVHVVVNILNFHKKGKVDMIALFLSSPLSSYWFVVCEKLTMGCFKPLASIAYDMLRRAVKLSCPLSITFLSEEPLSIIFYSHFAWVFCTREGCIGWKFTDSAAIFYHDFRPSRTSTAVRSI